MNQESLVFITHNLIILRTSIKINFSFYFSNNVEPYNWFFVLDDEGRGFTWTDDNEALGECQIFENREGLGTKTCKDCIRFIKFAILFWYWVQILLV